MFHDSGAKLPPFVGTKSPEEVAAAVVKAIERNRAEVDVAPIGLRAGAIAGGLLPEPWRTSSAGSAVTGSPSRWPRASDKR